MLVVVVFDPIYIPSKSDDEKAKNYVGSLTYSNPVTGGNLAEAIWPTDLSPSRTPGFYLLKRPILAKSPWNFDRKQYFDCPSTFIYPGHIVSSELYVALKFLKKYVTL